MISSLHLGASLYVPATRPDLVAIGNGEKYPGLRSVIFCTEDAIRSDDVPYALDNLESSLRRLSPMPLLRFVRVRNPAFLRHLTKMDGVRHLTGVVVPKATRRNLDEYFDCLLPDMPLQVMLVLETAEVFDAAETAVLRDVLLQERYRRRVLSLRVGGNDLLQLLALRRPRRRSIYATPLGPLIAQLAATFRPHGFNLTGPVCEYLSQNKLLARETREDLAHGLFGKSAIHPDQVPIIEAQYRVHRRDLEEAERILVHDAPPVFRLNDAMCEPATHRAWACGIVERARIYGVNAAEGHPNLLQTWPNVTLRNNGTALT